MVRRVVVGFGLAFVSSLAGCESVPLSDVNAACGQLGSVQQPFSRKCFEKDLQPVADPERADYGHVPCRIVTIASVGSAECACTERGLLAADDALGNLARSGLVTDGACRDACCDNYCFCELPQLSGADLDYCWDVEAEPRPFNEAPSGWCYVEPEAGFGNPELVAECPAGGQRLLRMIPGSNWNVALACQG